MARPKKNNMDYFSHDNGMRNDRKVKALRAKFNLEGYAVFNMILEILCESELLIIKWDQTEMELISGDLNIVSDRLTEITEYLLHIGLLNNVNGWLFCEELDKRSAGVFDKRTHDLDSLREINGINLTEIDVNDTESTQSKVKDSKGKKSKVNTLHAQMRAEYEKHYFDIKEIEYYWQAKDGSALKQLITKLKKSTGDETKIMEAWMIILKHNPDKWINDNLSISIINSKYNEIIAKIKNNIHGTGYNRDEIYALLNNNYGY